MRGADKAPPGYLVHGVAELEDAARARAAVDDIFFFTSRTQSFSTDAARAAFHDRWLGRYLENWPDLCFVAESEAGDITGYLAGCPDNPVLSPDFADHRYYTLFEDECRTSPAHLHINVLPGHRGEGVGRALIERFAAACRSRACGGLHAVTAEGDRNNRFFENCGLTIRARGDWNGMELVFCGRSL